MRREPEVGLDARCCVKVATRRLLEEQLAVVEILESGKKDDAMCLVPHLISFELPMGFQNFVFFNKIHPLKKNTTH